MSDIAHKHGIEPTPNVVKMVDEVVKLVLMEFIRQNKLSVDVLDSMWEWRDPKSKGESQ